MNEFPFPPRSVDAATKDWMSQAKDWADGRFKFGSGSPEGVVTANIGCQYVDTDGGASVTLYVKESGTGSKTGWVAK